MSHAIAMAAGAIRGSKTIHEVLADYVPGEARLQYRTDGCKAFSETRQEEISRAKFVELFTNSNVLQLASTASDAPRDEAGAIKRSQLITQVEKELRILWGDLTGKLRAIADANLGEESPTGIAYRQTIVGLFTRLVTMGIHKRPVDKRETIQLATRCSLVLCVRRMLHESPAGFSSRWFTIQEGFEAFFRQVAGPASGEFIAVLAMRYELAQQLGVAIPNTADQRDLQRLGQKFGAIDPNPTVRGRMTGGGRLAVLSRRVTDHILALPIEEATSSLTSASDDKTRLSDDLEGTNGDDLVVSPSPDAPRKNAVSDAHEGRNASLSDGVTLDRASLNESRREGGLE